MVTVMRYELQLIDGFDLPVTGQVESENEEAALALLEQVAAFNHWLPVGVMPYKQSGYLQAAL